MKKFTILLAVIAMGAVTASAQGLNVDSSTNANVNVNANSNASENAGASSSANVNANANATATAETRGNSNSEEDSSGERVKGASSASDVSLKAREIRGWSEDEKSEFLLSVKSHAELQSGQDLENFAKGVLASDENVESVEASEDKVEVSYKMPAKFLGIFGTELSATADVTFESASENLKEVDVKFPWYRLFYSLDEEVRAEVLENAVEASVASSLEAGSDNVYSRNGRLVQLVSNILKGIRANVEVEATASN